MYKTIVLKRGKEESLKRFMFMLQNKGVFVHNKFTQATLFVK